MFGVTAKVRALSLNLSWSVPPSRLDLTHLVGVSASLLLAPFKFLEQVLHLCVSVAQPNASAILTSLYSPSPPPRRRAARSLYLASSCTFLACERGANAGRSPSSPSSSASFLGCFFVLGS